MMEPFHFALIGEAIGYSRSPRIFEAVFRQLGVEGDFRLCSVTHRELKACLKQLIAEQAQGFSVTIPHKQAVMEHLDQLTDTARPVNAVNSVAIRDGRLVGYNTDGFGFSFGLERAEIGGAVDSALVLGAGGAARAVVCALYQDFGLRRFSLTGRNLEKLNRFKSALEQQFDDAVITVHTNPAAFAGRQRCITVNCTPLGGANYPDHSPLPAEFDFSGVSLYYDLNYNPDNCAIKAAGAAGVPTIDGSAMLVAQAIRSFELWTGRTVEFDPIYRAVFPDH